MTITLNADMRVGAVAETITVTGETPVVDVQNSTRVQQVLSGQVARGAAGIARIRQSAGDLLAHSGQRHSERRRQPGR